MVTKTHLSPDDLVRYRTIIADMDMDDNQKDDVIRVVHAVMQAFVDVSFSNDSVQISVSSRLSESFRKSALYDNLPVVPMNEKSTASVFDSGAVWEP